MGVFGPDVMSRMGEQPHDPPPAPGAMTSAVHENESSHVLSLFSRRFCAGRLNSNKAALDCRPKISLQIGGQTDLPNIIDKRNIVAKASSA